MLPLALAFHVGEHVREENVSMPVWLGEGNFTFLKQLDQCRSGDTEHLCCFSGCQLHRDWLKGNRSTCLHGFNDPEKDVVDFIRDRS